MCVEASFLLFVISVVLTELQADPSYFTKYVPERSYLYYSYTRRICKRLYTQNYIYLQLMCDYVFTTFHTSDP